jgi:hypothetical protein
VNEPTTVAAPVEASTVKKPRRTSLVLIILVLVGTYSALFIPAFSAQTPNAQLGYGAMFWSGVGFYYLWKRRGRGSGGVGEGGSEQFLAQSSAS